MPVIEHCGLALCAGIAAIGYGSGLARFLRIRPNLGDRGIAGLFVLAAVGCTVHFVSALSAPVQIFLLAGGVAMAAALRHDVCDDLVSDVPALAALCLFMLLRPQAPLSYDDGLYHLQTFKWNRELPLTPGLANLHGRLAFNSILFLIAPLTDRLGVGSIPNLLSTTFVVLSLWARIRRIGLNERREAIELCFMTLVLAFLLAKSHLEILDADAFLVVLILYWVALALQFSHAVDRRTVFALLLISAVLAATAKTSAAPLVALTLALAWFHRTQPIVRTAPIYAVSAALVIVWMSHGVALSGCAVYPVRQTCLLALPWAASPAQVDKERLTIQSWARKPGEYDIDRVMQDWSWFAPWFARICNAPIMTRQKNYMQLLGVSLVLGTLALVLAGKQIRRQPRDDLGLIASGLLASLGFWFLSAPDPRFGTGFILATAAFGLSLAAAAWLYHPRLLSCAPYALLCLVAVSGARTLLRFRVEAFSYSPPQAAVFPLRTARETQGIRLWVTHHENRCWEEQLPCTNQCWAQQLPCTPDVNPAALAHVHWPATWFDPSGPALEPPRGYTPPPY